MTEVEWFEWGVLRTWGSNEGEVSPFGQDYRTARKCAHDWPGILVRRIVRADEWVPREGNR